MFNPTLPIGPPLLITPQSKAAPTIPKALICPTKATEIPSNPIVGKSSLAKFKEGFIPT